LRATCWFHTFIFSNVRTDAMHIYIDVMLGGAAVLLMAARLPAGKA
jgi:hypothetical protein